MDVLVHGNERALIKHMVLDDYITNSETLLQKGNDISS